MTELHYVDLYYHFKKFHNYKKRIYIYIYKSLLKYNKPIKIYKIITHNIAFCITNIWSDPKSIWK